MSETIPQGFERIESRRTPVRMCVTVSIDGLTDEKRDVLRRQSRDIVRNFARRCEHVTGDTDHVDRLPLQYDAVSVDDDTASIAYSIAQTDLTDDERRYLADVAQKHELLFQRLHAELSGDSDGVRFYEEKLADIDV